MDKTEWIVDPGATYKLDSPFVIFLPDGTSRTVAFAGKARLNKDNTLEDVLYVPEFTHSLLSVARLIENLDIKCTFFYTHCTFYKCIQTTL